jgi:hypothetical protein
VKKTALRSIASSKRERRMNGIADLYAAVKRSFGSTYPAQDDDRARNLVWTIADHAVSRPPSWRGRYETDCHADDRRCCDLCDSGTAHLSGHLTSSGANETTPKLQTCQLRNRAPITSSELAWRWQRLSSSGLRRPPLPVSAPPPCSWLSEICRP